MAKHILLKVTKVELMALCSAVDTLYSVMEEDLDTRKEIKAVDRMLKRNGYKRLYG